jgi:CDP-glucose 4,6-dehydratase
MTMEFTDALRGARVLVTGNTGFKGSWLTAWLLELGAEVAGFALPPEGEDPLHRRLGLEDRIRQVYGDIREEAPIVEAVADFRPDAVMHLAAQSLVLQGYAEPKLTFDTNVGGSVNVLEAVRRSPDVRALVYVTTDKCYANREDAWSYRESDRLGGADPYSASKAAAEIVFDAYARSYFAKREDFGAVSVRAGNVIGGGDWAQDRIVPDCIRALRAGKPVGVRNPGSIRPWQHVLEPLCGYLTLAARLLEAPGSADGAWNFGPAPADMRPVRELVDRVVSRWGTGSVELLKSDQPPHETKVLYLNSDKAQRVLNWQPRWDFGRAVDETVGWYREVGAGADAGEVTRRQIAAYMDRNARSTAAP